MSGMLYIPLMPWDGGLVVPTATAVAYYLTKNPKTTVTVGAGVLVVAGLINFLELQF